MKTTLIAAGFAAAPSFLFINLILAVAFAGGWKLNGMRLEAKFAQAQIAAVEEYERIRNEQRVIWEAQAQADMEAQLELTAELMQSQRITKELQEQVAGAELVARAPVTIIEKLSECPTHEEVETIVVNHNPFTRSFVQLWNRSARGTNAGTDPPD